MYLGSANLSLALSCRENNCKNKYKIRRLIYPCAVVEKNIWGAIRKRREFHRGVRGGPPVRRAFWRMLKATETIFTCMQMPVFHVTFGRARPKFGVGGKCPLP